MLFSSQDILQKMWVLQNSDNSHFIYVIRNIDRILAYLFKEPHKQIELILDWLIRSVQLGPLTCLTRLRFRLIGVMCPSAPILILPPHCHAFIAHIYGTWLNIRIHCETRHYMGSESSVLRTLHSSLSTQITCMVRNVVWDVAELSTRAHYTQNCCRG